MVGNISSIRIYNVKSCMSYLQLFGRIAVIFERLTGHCKLKVVDLLRANILVLGTMYCIFQIYKIKSNCSLWNNGPNSRQNAPLNKFLL